MSYNFKVPNERRKQAGKLQSCRLDCGIHLTTVAYFQGGVSKSTHIYNFLYNFYLNYPTATKYSKTV